MSVLKSKTFWVGFAMFLVAGLHAIRHMVPVLSNIPDVVWREVMDALSVGGTGLAAIFLRLAISGK